MATKYSGTLRACNTSTTLSHGRVLNVLTIFKDTANANLRPPYSYCPSGSPRSSWSRQFDAQRISQRLSKPGNLPAPCTRRRGVGIAASIARSGCRSGFVRRTDSRSSVARDLTPYNVALSNLDYRNCTCALTHFTTISPLIFLDRSSPGDE